MKKISLILVIGFVFATAQAQMINPLKQGMPNTVTLSSGDVVYDLNGEWDAVIDNDVYGTEKDVIKITQEGNKFVGIKLIGGQWIKKDEEVIKGELEGDGFKSFFGYNIQEGWQPSSAKIMDGGNKIVDEQEVKNIKITSRMTLTRK